MLAVDLGGRSSFLTLPVLLLFTAAAGAAAGYAAQARASHGAGGGAAEGADAAADAPLPGQVRSGGLAHSRAVPDPRSAPPADEGQSLPAGRSFAAGIAITVITYMAAFAAQLALPSVLRLSGAEPALVGLIMIGYPLALVVTAPLSGSLSDRKGPLGILTAGLLLMSGTLLALGLAAPALGAGALVLPVVLLGCAMGMITSPNTSIVMGLAPRSRLGRVSSILALSRNIGMMFGTAAGGLVIGGGASGSNGSYMAVFLTCSAAVGLSGAWLLHIFRRSGKRKGVRA
ncbi:MFS transporter [Paenibacillus sp. S150]|nr:MFS transporter [Paenibacillus sp. S150]